MTQLICRPVLAAILLAWHLPAAGQDAPVQRIEITGSGSAQRQDDSASAVLVGRDQLLRHGDRSLTDALRRVPGVTVGGGKDGGIRLRGLGNGYTTVLLNGAPLPAGFDLDALAPTMIERVEIVRTASVELAAQGIAGTINIVLRRQPGRVRNEARLGVERAGMDRTAAMLAPAGGWQWAGQGDGMDWSFNGAVTGTALPASGTAQDSATGHAGQPALLRRGQTWEDNWSRSLSLSPRLAWKYPGGNVAWQGFANLVERGMSGGDHETTLFGQPNDFPDNARRMAIHGVLARSEWTWQQELAEGVKGNARLLLSHYPRRSDFAFRSLAGGQVSPDLHRVQSAIRDRTIAASGKLEMAVAPDHTAVLGWDMEVSHRQQSRSEHDFVAGAGTDDRYRGAMERAAVFIQDEWRITGAWSLSAGLRWETLHTAVTPRGADGVAQRTTVASPLLQTLYKTSATQRWRAGLSRTYKNPTMMELIPRRYTVDNGNSPADPDNQGNPRLRPELAWGLDAGVEQDVGHDGTLAVGLYRRRIAGVNVPLLFNDGGRWVRMPANQGRADAWGLSFDVKTALTAAWTVRANLARDGSRVAAIPGPGNRLARQTPRSAGAGADWRVDDSLTVGADIAWQDGGWSRWSAALAELAAPSCKLDVYAAWRLGEASRLRIAGANLLRRDARTATVYADGNGERRLAATARGVAAWRIDFEHRW